ncbi:MAG: tRNA (adenosine(37)-N6)-threonylcarbamoyltransferase complex dimerization subunit type 1 TsaB [bacterium]
MKLLAIESSAKAASICLTEDGALVSQYFTASALTHSKTLLVMAEQLLQNLELTVSQLDAIAVARGPGSFTGVRIGVAAAKGLCWGADKPAIGVSTLEAMAWHLADREGCRIAAAMDARRGEFYNAVFRAEGGRPVRLTEDRPIPLAALMEEAKAAGVPYWFVGDGAKKCQEGFLAAGLPAYLAPEPLLLQSAWGVAKAAEGQVPQDAGELTVNYLRLSQAERERNERLNLH